MAPLLNPKKINDRLDAIEEMIANQHQTDVLRARLGKLPDLEKLLAKIFTYSIKHKVKAIYFEDVSLNKMKEFRTLLLCLKHLEQTLEPFLDLVHSETTCITSTRLQLLFTGESQGGLLPEKIKDVIDEFEQLIAWKQVAGSNGRVEIPEPQSGIDEEFDNANLKVN